MPEILITVRDKLPVLTGDVKALVTDNSDYTIRFTFDEQWEDGAKTVYFVRSNGYVYEPVKTVNDTVSIPIQHDAGLMTRLLIGVQQGNIKTSRPCALAIYPSVADIIEDDAVQPDTSLWENFMKRLERLEKSGGGGSGGGVAFEVGNALELTDDGVLNVITTDEAEQDNTLPITSSGVHTIVGNIGAILDTI